MGYIMKQIYTIYDTVADECGPLMIFNNTDQAQRAYPSAFSEKSAPRSDFKLLFLGYLETNINTLTEDEKAILGIIPEDVTPYLGEEK